MNNKSIIYGALSAIIATFIMVIVNALAKEVGSNIHTVEIVFFRHLFGFISVVIIIIAIRKHDLFKTSKLIRHILRAIVGTITMFLLFYSVQYLSITESTALFFLGPIFLAVMSWPILKEKVGIYKTICIISALIGAYIIIQPDHISSTTGAALAIGSAFFSGLVMLCLRWVGKTEKALTIVFYYALSGIIMLSFIVPFFWITPTLYEFSILVTIGISSTILQFFMTRSFILLPANVAGAMLYFQIVWAVIIDMIIWGIIPDTMIIAGALIIICSNTIILWREKKGVVSHNLPTSNQKKT